MEKYMNSKSRPYRIWTHLKSRCDNPNHSKYEIYGGKGISYDNKWVTFDGFWEDMKDGYSDSLTIDRIDSELNYEKSNCRWATYKQQNNNKSDNLNLSHNGKDYTVHELAQISKLSESAVYTRLQNGWSVEKILKTPKLKQGEYESKRNSKEVVLFDDFENEKDVFKSIRDASEKLSLSYEIVKNILHGKTKSHNLKLAFKKGSGTC